MIKRQFYRAEHNDGDNDDVSSSSDEEEEKNNEKSPEEELAESGYESEDSSHSGEEIDAAEAWPGKISSDENEESETLKDTLKKNRNIDLVNDRVDGAIESAQSKYSNQWAEAVDETERDRALDDLDDCVIQCKSVFRCKLCPRIICLTVNTIKMHLDSKRHARSRKLLSEGRLKLMLNSDGEMEEEAETHGERHSRIVASVQSQPDKETRKRSKGRQRQKNRKKKKMSQHCKGKS